MQPNFCDITCQDINNELIQRPRMNQKLLRKLSLDMQHPINFLYFPYFWVHQIISSSYGFEKNQQFFNSQQLVYYSMNKCEHNEKITIFCASDCCVWKQAAGCDFCMKKYHNHMGPTIFLTEEEIIALVKKYTMDSNIKPKCRLLQQAIYSYFNLIKNEITASIDIVCKNIINQIGYPYLYSNNMLSTYKRLKNKEYKKLVQKEFKSLYQLSQKISQKDLIKEESKIYIEEMKHTEELLNGLEDIVKKYQSIIKTSYPAFAHDNSFISKINQILKSLNTDSPSKISKSKDVVRQKQSPKVEITTSSIKEKQDSKLKPTQLKKTTSENTPTPNRYPVISIIPPAAAAKPNYSRDVSIDRKIVKERKFSNAAAQKPQEKQKEFSILQVKPTIMDKIEQLKSQANNKQIEINEKKKMLIEKMKQKQDSLKKSSHQIDKKQQSKLKVHETPSYFKREFSQRSANRENHVGSQLQKYQQYDSNLKTLNDDSQDNSNNQFQITDGGSKNEERDVQNHAFTQLPLVQNEVKKFSQIEEVKEKVFFVPKIRQLEQITYNDEVHSPIFKNFNKSIVIKPKQQFPPTEQKIKIERQTETLKTKTAVFSKHSEVLQLKQNQQKSLALLLKSLTLNAGEATKYLESALDQAENNLSAAEYLTYLYLQQNKPHDCLRLCNKMLQKLANSNQPEQLSLLINNNKAAALNILGRYSESIMILQKCLRYREKDYFYKNLGDAYFSISIYEKAIYNYQKTLKINEYYDQAQYNLAVCLYIQENYFNAKLAIKKALEMQPQNEAYLELLFNIETRISNC